MSASRSQSTPPHGHHVNGYNYHPQSQPHVPSNYAYHSHQHSYNQSTMAHRDKRASQPGRLSHSHRPMSPSSDSGIHSGNSYKPRRKSAMNIVGCSIGCIPMRTGNVDAGRRHHITSDSSLQHHTGRGTKIQRNHSLSSTDWVGLPHRSSSSSQASQVSYTGSNMEGYPSTVSWETCSATSGRSSQSDFTQISEMSEPVFKRPRPRRSRPSSAHSRKTAPSLPLNNGRAKTPNPVLSRGEAWHMEEEREDREARSGSFGSTTSHLDQAVFAGRLPRHYFHPLPPHPSNPPQPSNPPRHSSQSSISSGFSGDSPMSPQHPALTRSVSYQRAVSPQTKIDHQQRPGYGGGVPSPRQASSNYEYRVAAPERTAAAIQSRRIVSTVDQRSGSPSGHIHAPVPHHYMPQPQAQVASSYSYPNQTTAVPRFEQHPHHHHQTKSNPSPPPSISSYDEEQPQRSLKGSSYSKRPLRERNRMHSSPLTGGKLKKNSSDSRLNVLSTHRHGRESPQMIQRYSTGVLLDQDDRSKGRRVSSPEGQMASHMLQRYFPSRPEEIQEFSPSMEEQDLTVSDSEGSPPHKRASRSKSAGSLVLQKIAKKLSKISVKGEVGGGENLEKERETERFRRRQQLRSSRSASNLDSTDGPGLRTHSMEHLNNDRVLDVVRGFSTPDATPIGTPHGTPKMNRTSSKTKLGRRGSEPDLEGALSTLFRTGSKRNLTGDPSEALFDCIEQDNVEGVQQLLEANMVTDLNMTNEDEFTPVDLAVMLNHTQIAKMLLAKGAKDSTKYCRDPFTRFSRIVGLLMESEKEMEFLKEDLLSQNVGSNMKDLERKLKKCKGRTRLFKKMKSNYEHAEPPAPPTNVSLHVTSNRSLTVTFSEPEETNGATVTRYKIEWCRREVFAPIVGEFVMTDLRSTEYIIPDLNKGESYFVRVSAYNMRGFGHPQLANPPSAVPSSWHDVNGSQPRYEGSTNNILTISAQLSMMLSHSPPISPPAGHGTGTSAPYLTRTKTMKKGISKLFGSAVKFHKSLKAGVYLASMVYSDDSKVLVTMDDNIPIVEVSDSHSSTIGADFVWLAKVACTWDHVRGMCDISDSYTSSPAVQFRNKLLHAILDLQGALGIQDLGLLHPVPYRDSHGAIVFVITQYLKDTRGLQVGGSLKWANLPRLWKKRSQPNGELETLPVPDQVVLDAQEIIAHHTNSTRLMLRGLYLSYLKARSSVASMKVICSREYPNVLPHIKIRDNPNISSEEWEWLKSLASPPGTSSPYQYTPGPTPSHSLQKTLLSTIDTFLHNLGIPKEDAEKHQLYCHEVIELNEDISLILLLPPHEYVCTAPGSTDHFADLPDFVALPINTFEIMQLYTYQRSFMTKFSMVSARLDIELLTSQQRLREAFYKEEVASSKQMQSELESYQDRTEQAWKQMRWIEDAVQKGRDLSAGVETLLPLRQLRDAVKSHPPNGLTIKRTTMVQTIHRAGLTSGYLRVFPAYNTGLVKGTSVKLFITLKTTTSEVIRLVVQQLEKTRLDKRIPGPRLTEDDLTDFFLVAVSGSKEQVLDSQFYPLELQIQSSKWRLFLKRKSEERRLDEQATSV